MKIPFTKHASGDYHRITWFLSEKCFPVCYHNSDFKYLNCDGCLLKAFFTYDLEEKKIKEITKTSFTTTIETDRIIFLGDEQEYD